MTVRRKPQWNRLSSGLYVPPVLGFAGNPYPCPGCCCVVCLGNNYPAEIDIEADGFVNDSCTKCLNFNTTWTVPLAIPCQRAGHPSLMEVVYGDTFTPDIDYKPLFAPCEALTSIRWKITIGRDPDFHDDRSIDVELFITTSAGEFRFISWGLYEGTSTAYDCMNFASLDIPDPVWHGVYTATCEQFLGDRPTVALTANP